MTDPAVSPFDLIREAHEKAMEALAADVHPLSGPAIRQCEEVHASALDQLQRDHEALAAERGEADQRLTVEHVERLERRIKEQRDHITRLIGMREPGDRYTRKRMAALERALGRVSLRAEKLKEDFAAYRARTDADLDAAVREAETLREALGPEYHVYDCREDGWSVRHPVSCRDQILDCPVHLAVRSLDEPPVAVGRWRLDLDTSGHPVFSALASSRDTTETTA